MTGKWDPLAQPPANVSVGDLACWKFEHIAAFQAIRSELPQGNWGTLKERDKRLVLIEYDLAVAKAKHGGILPTDLEKAIRTGTLTVSSR